VSRLRVLRYMVVIQAVLVAVAWAVWSGVLAVVMSAVFAAADILGAVPLRPRRWPATRRQPEDR
jgi:hypothetical protein